MWRHCLHLLPYSFSVTPRMFVAAQSTHVQKCISRISLPAVLSRFPSTPSNQEEWYASIQCPAHTDASRKSREVPSQTVERCARRYVHNAQSVTQTWQWLLSLQPCRYYRLHCFEPQT